MTAIFATRLKNVRVLGRRSGKQVLCMLGTGKMTDSTEEGDSSMKMESTMKETSSMIKRMAKGCITIMMGQFIRAIFKITARMATGLRNTAMGPLSKADLTKGKNLKENSYGLMGQNTLVISHKI